jgi:hypothetical protein
MGLAEAIRFLFEKIDLLESNLGETSDSIGETVK